jgi:RNA recognition motif-containing protein
MDDDTIKKLKKDLQQTKEQEFNYINNNNMSNGLNQYDPNLFINQYEPRTFKNTDFRHEKTILYISDLPYNTTEADLKLFFERYIGSISYFTILGQNYHHENKFANPTAKVIFKDHQSANKARIEMNLRKLKGHAIRLMWDDRESTKQYNSSTLFVKGIPFNIQPREVYEYFFQFGDISSAKLKENPDGNHLGYGYVTFFSQLNAEKALKTSNGKVIWGGSPLEVHYFKNRIERISTTGPEVFKLYITNFSSNVTEDKIIELTKDFGGILSCEIKMEKIGRRYALVCFEEEESAKNALESLNGKNIDGYNLFCKIMQEKNYNEEESLNQNKYNKNNYNKRFFQRNPLYLNKDNNNLCNLVIKDIPYTIKEKEFYDIFSKYGKILSAKLETSDLIQNIGNQPTKTTMSKGIGYVCFEDKDVARLVKEKLNGGYLPKYEYWKKPLRIEYYMPRSMKTIMQKYNYNNNIYEEQNYFMENGAPKQMPKFNKEEFDKLSNDDDKNEYLGNYIFEYILKIPFICNDPQRENIAGKITGMALDKENFDVILNNVNNKESLDKFIIQAKKLLDDSHFDFSS